MRTRLGLTIACAAIAACGARSGEAGKRGSASAGAGGAAATVTLAIDDASFTTCHCHHGCGPGADGMIGLTVTNLAAASALVVIDGVTLAPATGPALASSGSGYLTLRVDGKKTANPIELAPAATRTIAITAYLDGPAAEAGRYSLTVRVIVDDHPVTVERADLAVPFAASGC